MKILLSFILILITATIGLPQSLAGNLFLASPQGEFRNNVNNLGFGIQFHGTLWSPSKERPFAIGLSGGYIIYGQVSERKPWIGFPGIFLNLTRTNSIANLHMLFQVNPFTGTIRPYAEGIFGGAYIFTESEVKSEGSNMQIASSTNFDDFAWSYGGGAGALIKLSENSGKVQLLFLDLKVRYIFGTEAKYLTENSVFVNPLGQTIFVSQKSKTDLLTFHIGVIAYLNR